MKKYYSSSNFKSINDALTVCGSFLQILLCSVLKQVKQRQINQKHLKIHLFNQVAVKGLSHNIHTLFIQNQYQLCKNYHADLQPQKCKKDNLNYGNVEQIEKNIYTNQKTLHRRYKNQNNYINTQSKYHKSNWFKNYEDKNFTSRNRFSKSVQSSARKQQQKENNRIQTSRKRQMSNTFIKLLQNDQYQQEWKEMNESQKQFIEYEQKARQKLIQIQKIKKEKQIEQDLKSKQNMRIKRTIQNNQKNGLLPVFDFEGNICNYTNKIKNQVLFQENNNKDQKLKIVDYNPNKNQQALMPFSTDYKIKNKSLSKGQDSIKSQLIITSNINYNNLQDNYQIQNQIMQQESNNKTQKLNKDKVMIQNVKIFKNSGLIQKNKQSKRIKSKLKQNQHFYQYAFQRQISTIPYINLNQGITFRQQMQLKSSRYSISQKDQLEHNQRDKVQNNQRDKLQHNQRDKPLHNQLQHNKSNNKDKKYTSIYKSNSIKLNQQKNEQISNNKSISFKSYLPLQQHNKIQLKKKTISILSCRKKSTKIRSSSNHVQKYGVFQQRDNKSVQKYCFFKQKDKTQINQAGNPIVKKLFQKYKPAIKSSSSSQQNYTLFNRNTIQIKNQMQLNQMLKNQTGKNKLTQANILQQYKNRKYKQQINNNCQFEHNQVQNNSSFYLSSKKQKIILRKEDLPCKKETSPKTYMIDTNTDKKKDKKYNFKLYEQKKRNLYKHQQKIRNININNNINRKRINTLQPQNYS